jgi:hypothetical protein
VKETAGLDLSLAVQNDSPPAAPSVSGAADEDATAEAVAQYLDDEPELAPDAATDVFTADEGVVDPGEPELDALQAAIQAANAWQASETDEGGLAAAQPSPQADASGLPEITLDVELDKRKPVANNLNRWADELSKAKSLEDISDILAETIFGNEEVEAISADIRARKAAERVAEPKAAPPTPAAREPQPAAKAQAPRPAVPPGSGTATRAQPKAPARPAVGNAANMTMSQRIEMVNSLKGRKPIRPIPGMQIAELGLAEQPDEMPPSSLNGPQPIEAQIDTAITQSRRVLSEADLARLASSDDDDDDKGKRGLFGFFRRSSKT